MRISYDPAKRDWTLANRGLDFEDAALVFDGLTAEVEDKRKDYGETRIVCFGVLHSRLVCWRRPKTEPLLKVVPNEN